MLLCERRCAMEFAGSLSCVIERFAVSSESRARGHGLRRMPSFSDELSINSSVANPGVVGPSPSVSELLLRVATDS
jgi:hypothetical protein